MTHQTLTTTEAERLAYFAGDTDRAALIARIDALQRALGLAVATLEEIAGMPDRHRTGAAAEALAIIGQDFDLFDIEGGTL
jgi:hypothetical protein